MVLAKNEEFTYTPDDLVVGEEIITEPEVIASGQNIARGAVLGKITASGKWVLSDPGAADGSQVARAIAVHDVDATAGDVTAPVYKSGIFNPDALTFGGAHDADSVAADFEGTPLFLRSVQVR